MCDWCWHTARSSSLVAIQPFTLHAVCVRSKWLPATKTITERKFAYSTVSADNWRWERTTCILVSKLGRCGSWTLHCITVGESTEIHYQRNVHINLKPPDEKHFLTKSLQKAFSPLSVPGIHYILAKMIAKHVIFTRVSQPCAHYEI